MKSIVLLIDRGEDIIISGELIWKLWDSEQTPIFFETEKDLV